jgi:hypothetical protein
MHIPPAIIRQKETELGAQFAHFAGPGKKLKVRIKVESRVSDMFVSVGSEGRTDVIREDEWVRLLSIRLSEEHSRLLKALKACGNTGVSGSEIGQRPKQVVDGLRRILYKTHGFTVRSIDRPGRKLDPKQRTYKIFRL